MRPVLLRVIALLAAGLFGCSDLGDPYEYRADCDRSTGSMSFGSVPLGHFRDRTLRIANSGNTDLTGSVDFSDPNFSVTSGGGDFVVAPNEAWEVGIRYAPKDTGNHHVEIELGGLCPPVDVAGLGVPPPEGPQCVADPPALAFGDVKTGEVAEASLEIRNVGLIRFNADVALPGGSFFMVTEGAGLAALEPGDTLRVRIRFAPTTTGAAAAHLAIGSTCGDLEVSGTGTPPYTVSYATDIQPIFNSYCVLCHGSGGQGGLNLRAPNSYNQLVNVTSFGYAPDLRVKPGDPAGSVLYGKVSDSGLYGGPMPQTGPPVPLAQQSKIATWITEGAVRN